MKYFLAVAAIVFGLALANPWSVPTDTVAHHVAVDRSAVDQSTVDRHSVESVGTVVAEAPRMVVVSPQCYCVDYGILEVPADAVTKQV
ncbi:hypothetical protein [Kutzneria kofuensis]|uniref:Uncharacterized protein n=1 Tax=Kutzneria kofuensis TaxID=103725 RepID=A0A7W9KN45_9PSEU|nr:hypothetical protein [Kutzneria kofuensis]MBB5895353.1 hypothetical protein [Kutzneria kofuensis]